MVGLKSILHDVLEDASEDMLHVSPEELAQSVGVSCNTVCFWRAGSSLPPPSDRKTVYAFFEKRLNEQAEHAEKLE